MTPENWREAKQAHGRWKRLAAAFFKAPKAPTAFETEAFVSRVMSRLEAERPRAPWWAMRWLVPALGVGLAMLLFGLGRTTQDVSLSLDTQLLVDGSGAAQLVSPAASRGEWLLLPESDR